MLCYFLKPNELIAKERLKWTPTFVRHWTKFYSC